MSTFFVSKSRSVAAGERTAETELHNFGLPSHPSPKRPQRSVTLRDLNADLDPGLWRTILKGLDAVPVASGQTRPLAAMDGSLTKPLSSTRFAVPGDPPRGPDAAPQPPPLQAPESVAGPSEPRRSGDRPRLKASPRVIDRSVSASGRTRLSSVSESESPKILEDVIEGARGIVGCALRASSFLRSRVIWPSRRPLRGVLLSQPPTRRSARPDFSFAPFIPSF